MVGVVFRSAQLSPLDSRHHLEFWARRHSGPYNVTQTFTPYLYQFLSCLPCTTVFYADFDLLPLSDSPQPWEIEMARKYPVSLLPAIVASFIVLILMVVVRYPAAVSI